MRGSWPRRSGLVVDACHVPTSATTTRDVVVARAADNEVARVVAVLEANEVHVEEASKEIIVDGDDAEVLGGGEQQVE